MIEKNPLCLEFIHDQDKWVKKAILLDPRCFQFVKNKDLLDNELILYCIHSNYIY